jgi:hypothetical protein
MLRGLDASLQRTPDEKAAYLRTSDILSVAQKDVATNIDCVISFEVLARDGLLSAYAKSVSGMKTGDVSRFNRNFWEIFPLCADWEFIQQALSGMNRQGGREEVIFWQEGRGDIFDLAQFVKGSNHVAQNWRRGQEAWGKSGVAITALGGVYADQYGGHIFDSSVTVVYSAQSDKSIQAAIFSYCTSPEYEEAVRKIDNKLSVTTATLVKVPFDLTHWQQVAAERYPNGLPKPYSDDPTQWLFHGHPQPATDPLQVAVARLVGYRWPAETDTAMELSDEARTWITRCDKLAEHTDDDGIVCLPSVRGETPAHDRLLKLLIAAWEAVEPGSWKPAVLDKLLADADCAGKGLDVWLREKFFEQHAKRFHHRPFIWHVWDGQKDGFAALVNYHQLDTKNLERLIHTYLGDWIRQQEAGVRDGADGAPTRLAAALDLKRRLELILEGEFDGKVGYDIFVRWKKLSEQPIGWNPDLNDGVRMNIRPFMTAEVLRHNRKPKLNITWDKDRGKDVESAPWFKTFGGDRINDHHLTRAEKLAAQEKKS